jgi:23S rRNA (uracil1939-C5)-methyltransferase
MAAGGDALARNTEGKVVFVTGALPGELVDAEVLADRRDFSRARAVQVLEPSPHRVTAPCPELARGCGGCQWQHISVEGQRLFKEEVVADALRRIAHLENAPFRPTIALPAEGYRTTVRAAVVDGRAGYRHGGSHDVVTVESCLVAHPLVVDLLVNGRFTGAQEVVLRCGARTGERMAAADPIGASIVVPGDVRRDHVHEEVAGRRWRISADSFFQARPDGADALAELVAGAAEELGHVRNAVDLYAGVGLFAGVLATRGWTVAAVEGGPAAVADAEINLRDTGAAVVHADVNQWRPSAADLVVADPSRSGLGRGGTAAVAGTGARRLVLVSCDVAAFARDVGLLAAAGYGLTSVTPVDLFPHTVHVELVGVFDRAD